MKTICIKTCEGIETYLRLEGGLMHCDEFALLRPADRIDFIKLEDWGRNFTMPRPHDY